MRIALITEKFFPAVGGIESFSMRLITELERRGHAVLLITDRLYERLPDHDPHREYLHRVPMSEAMYAKDPEGILRAKRSVERLCREFNPDLVHVNVGGITTMLYYEIGRRLGKPQLLSVHGRAFLPHEGLNSLTHRFLRAADWVSACSQSSLTIHTALEPAIRDHSSVIYYGLEFPEGEPRPLPAEPKLLWLGRMSAEKGADIALEAFARVAPRFPALRLTVAGNGPHRAEVEQLADALGIANRVDFVGWVSREDVPRVLSEHSMLVMSSRWEGFGFVALEAALQARPTVAFAVEGLPEAVIDGQTGLLAPPEDVDALAEHIVTLLEHPDRAEALGQAGYRRTRAQFSIGRMTDDFERLYRQLAGTNASG